MDLGIEQLIFRTCGSSATTRNRVLLLNDGREMYAALLAALHRARHTIHLEYYIFDDDRIGQAISEVLIRRARSGVQVRLIYDIIGSWMPAWGTLRRLRQAGVEVCYFRPLGWREFFQKINIRNHRKIAIIDGQIAFLGGINIARRYLEGTELGHWRDEHLQLEGEVVATLQALFHRDWLRVGGTYFLPKTVRPSRDFISIKQEASSKFNVRVQIAWSEEGETRKLLEQVLVRLIGSARSEVLLATPYFIPTPCLHRALQTALARGVRVKLMLPARCDLRLAMWASQDFYGELLSLGASVYRYETGFLHTKMVVIDRVVSCLGTPNLDYRSLCTNWEVAAFITDRSFGRKAAALFRYDALHCRLVTSEDWQHRSKWQKIRNRVARIFRKSL